MKPSMRTALIASIAFNLFLAGFLAAWILRQPPAQQGQRVELTERGAIARLVAILPPVDRKIVRETVAGHRADLLKAQGEYLVALQAVGAEIRHSPSDPDKLRAAIDAAREKRQAVGVMIEDMLVDVVPRLSEEGRKRLSRVGGTSE